jgi:hypothetical protein
MAAALAALAASFLLPPLCAPLGFVLTLLYRALEFSVRFMGKAPGLDSPPALALITSVLAAALVFGLKRLDLRHRRRLVPFG